MLQWQRLQQALPYALAIAIRSERGQQLHCRLQSLQHLVLRTRLLQVAEQRRRLWMPLHFQDAQHVDARCHQ